MVDGSLTDFEMSVCIKSWVKYDLKLINHPSLEVRLSFCFRAVFSNISSLRKSPVHAHICKMTMHTFERAKKTTSEVRPLMGVVSFADLPHLQKVGAGKHPLVLQNKSDPRSFWYISYTGKYYKVIVTERFITILATSQRVGLPFGSGLSGSLVVLRVISQLGYAHFHGSLVPWSSKKRRSFLITIQHSN